MSRPNLPQFQSLKIRKLAFLKFIKFAERLLSGWNPRRLEIYGFPTGPFTIIDPLDQEISEFNDVQERRAADFEAS